MSKSVNTLRWFYVKGDTTNFSSDGYRLGNNNYKLQVINEM